MSWRPYGSRLARTGRPPSMASRSRTRQLLHFGRRQPVAIRVAGVAKAGPRPPAALQAGEGPRRIDRLQHEHVVVLHDLSTLLFGDERLMQLLAGADADDLDPAARRHRLDEVEDAHAGDLGHEDLAALHQLRAADGKADAVLQAEPEARHAGVRHRDRARRALGGEE